METHLEEIDVQDYSSKYYDTRYQGLGRRYHTEVVDWMLQGMEGKLLDVGCGTGFVSAVNPGKDITGVDLSPEMLRHHIFPYRTHLMDATRMEFPTGSFDGLICRSLLHHLPSHYAGLAEMHRVLKSGGHISFWEPNHSWLAAKVRQHTQHGDRFSHYHRSFHGSELMNDVRRYFEIDAIRYLGFLQYPLYGFRDIIDFSRWIPLNRAVYPLTRWLDQRLERIPGIQRWSWSLGIKAHKATL